MAGFSLGDQKLQKERKWGGRK